MFQVGPYPAIFLVSICKWIHNDQYWGTETNSRFLRLFSWHLCKVQLPSSMHPGSHPDQSVSPNIAARDIFFKSSYLGEGKGLRYFPNSLTVSTALRSKKSSPTLQPNTHYATMTITSAAAHGDTPNGSSDTPRSLSFTQKSTVLQSQGLKSHFWTISRVSGFPLPCLPPFGTQVMRAFASSLWMMTNGSSPRSHSPLLSQLTFLPLWSLCTTEKKLLITGSYFSCTFGAMGNKKIKGTRWAKTTSGLNCWYDIEAGIMSQMQITGRRKRK